MLQYVPGAAISPFAKGVTRGSTLVSPLRVTASAQLTRCMQEDIGEGGFQVFMLEANRAKLTSSRILQCIPALG